MGNEVQVLNQPLSAAEIRANVNRIQEVMKAVMIGPTKDNPAGVHYGVIPGTNKPTLYKAGSEKILATFRIAVEIEVDDLSTADAFRYRVKARGVLPSGEIIGCGIGECSTDEEKYRWRSAVNDKEWEATPEDRKRIKYSRPSQYNKDGETKQIRTSPADLANTVLKMAKKRAQIDLTLTATAASDVFEQDIEDLPEEYRDGMRETEQRGKPPVQQPQSKSQPSDLITDAQKKLIFAKMKSAGIEPDAIKAAFNVSSSNELKKSQVEEVLKWIEQNGQKEEKPLPEVCAECGEMYVNGACRNISCPEGKPEDE